MAKMTKTAGLWMLRTTALTPALNENAWNVQNKSMPRSGATRLLWGRYTVVNKWSKSQLEACMCNLRGVVRFWKLWSDWRQAMKKRITSSSFWVRVCRCVLLSNWTKVDQCHTDTESRLLSVCRAAWQQRNWRAFMMLGVNKNRLDEMTNNSHK